MIPRDLRISIRELLMELNEDDQDELLHDLAEEFGFPRCIHREYCECD